MGEPSLIEAYRNEQVQALFRIKSFRNTFEELWREELEPLVREGRGDELVGLGEHLKELFSKGSNKTRDQSQLSGGGTVWECLLCWWMNACLVGTRGIALLAPFAPYPLRDAMTINLGSKKVRSEPDMLLLDFPVDAVSPGGKKEALRKAISDLTKNHRSEMGVCNLQCKTNWNDNAQTVMLWSIVYGIAADAGYGKDLPGGMTVGGEYTLKMFHRFRYGFATVPTNKGEYKPTSLPALRLSSLSGFTYWGLPQTDGVARSLKSVFTDHFINAIPDPKMTLVEHLRVALPEYAGVLVPPSVDGVEGVAVVATVEEPKSLPFGETQT
jgi:hypothetical protein